MLLLDTLSLRNRKLEFCCYSAKLLINIFRKEKKQLRKNEIIVR